MVPRTLSPVQTYKSDSNGNSINAIATTNGNTIDAIDTNGDIVDDNGSTVSGGEEKEHFKDGEVIIVYLIYAWFSRAQLISFTVEHKY